MNETEKDNEVKNTDDTNKEMVHVSESIKYRKQAQEAEKHVELLSRKLEVADTNIQSLKNELEDASLESLLIGKLHNAGSIDIESGTLLAKKILKENKDVPVDEIIENLMKSKPHLFKSDLHRVGCRSALNPLRFRAGSRKDVHEFMRKNRR